MDDQITKIELISMIARVKRSAANREVVALCDAMEKFILAKPVQAPAPELVRIRFDKKTWQRAYMKVYMAKRRAKARELLDELSGFGH